MKMVKKIALISALAVLTTGFVFASGKKDVKKTAEESTEAVKEATKEGVENTAEAAKEAVKDTAETVGEKTKEGIDKATTTAEDILNAK